MNAKNITRIILGIAAIVLAYFLFESIMKPQRFETLKSRKEAEVINRLKDIRTAQIAFRNAHGRYCGTLDSLVMFLDKGKLPSVRRTGEIPEEMTEAEALRLKIIRRDTVFSDAYSVLFPPDTIKERHLTTAKEIEEFRQSQRENHLAGLKYIPFTGRTKEFTIETGFVDKGNISVPVIEVSAHLLDYMPEEDYRVLVVNSVKRMMDINRFPGRKFGSMTDPQTEGNWE
ncbi:MAG: hypothetical protein LBP96_04150 [Bacteroidales bacterium]|jgi:hypothetical protein|nr:hypothetical protein [Bacteroidales bacterium]